MYLEIETFLTEDERRRLCAMNRSGAFAPGLATARGAAKHAKNNEQLEATKAQTAEIKKIFLGACHRSAALMAFARPSEVGAPLLSRYRPGMSYGRHLDLPFSGGERQMRTDLSITVFLSEPETYDGGALLLDTDYGEVGVKLPAGHAVCYSTLLWHQVAPVTRGERLGLVSWLQSRIRDPQQRALLYDVTMAHAEVSRSAPGSPAAERLQKTVMNMIRLWSEA